MNLLIEDGIGEPKEGFHYHFRQSGTDAEHRKIAENFLHRQGCTRIVHFTDEPMLFSAGYVERIEEVQRRAREPKYD